MHCVVILLVLQCMRISSLTCPDGWKYHTLSKDVPGNCYKAFGHKASWEGAVHHCMRYPKSILADLKDAQEQAYVKDNLLPDLTGNDDGVWLGARERRGRWKWVGGRSMDIHSFSWMEGNPDNGGLFNVIDTEDCLEMKKTGLLNDYKCFAKRPFICKMSNIEVPSTTIETTTTTTTTTERAAEKNAHTSSTGKHTGAKTAVGIVAGVICALLIVIVVAVIIRRRKSRRNLYDTTNAVSLSNEHLYDSLSTSNKLTTTEVLHKNYSSSKQTSELEHTYESVAFSII
ncbi:neurocan core protein-like isoform X2 [Mya arenaria]|uniref:neurocan core protein-like isoform X2 n=1 Tax=Mya arenaria TaxID=6604 RepID=UPI0022E75696|nr:neurocan core protein-like isoform X2 [Mya arenaria]